MKKLSVLLLSVLAFVSCNKAGKIEVETDNISDDTKVEILTREAGSNEPKAIASGVVKDGKVVLDNPFTEADEAFLKFGDGLESTVFFLGEPGTITIKYDQKNPSKPLVGGTDNNKKLQAFQDKMAPVIERMMAFYNEDGMEMMMLQQSNEGQNDQRIKELQDKSQAIMTELDNKLTEFKEENKNSVLGLLAFYQQMGNQEMDVNELQKEFDTFSVDLKGSKIGKKIQANLDMLQDQPEALSIGEKLPDFKGLTPEGKELTLNTFIEGKKLILVDIWASWCGPCRQENPNLVKAYEKYNSKGFEIIGYSLDKDDGGWKGAIAKDKLAWAQVSNLLYWDDPIVGAYGIEGIPASFLIDGNGNILEQNLRGAELEKAIEKYLK